MWPVSIRWRQKALVGGAGALVIVGLCSVLLWQATAGSPANARDVARDKWAARPFANYRLVVIEQITTPTFDQTCEIDVEVQGNRVRRSFHNTCMPATGWTVDMLFSQSAALSVHHCYPAFSGGCACASSLDVKTTYDPELGYPRHITRRSETSVQWFHSDFWLYLWSTQRWPWCSAISGARIKTITVTALTPLP